MSTNTQRNRWIVDRGYGSGMAIGFEGDKNFIRRSVNFAINFLVHNPLNVHYHTPTFVSVNTTHERLEKALYDEAYARELLRLTTEFNKTQPNPLAILNDEDFPENFDEQTEKFRADLHAAADHHEVAQVLARDPTSMIFPLDNPVELEQQAAKLAKEFVNKTLEELEPEEFMRSFGVGMQEHAVAEMT